MQFSSFTTQFRKAWPILKQWPARLLFPPVCLSCRILVSLPGAFCPGCWRQVYFLEPPWCNILGTPFTVDMGERAISPEAIANPPPFNRARSAVLYQGVPQKLARALKFSDKTDLAPWMAIWMVRAGQQLIRETDIIIPVPLHRTRLLTRKFNQSAELSRNIARLTGLMHCPSALARKQQTRPQVGLTKSEREKNLKGAFHVPPRYQGIIKDKRVLLIDDVFTTGTTVKTAATTLLKARAASVEVLTFARVSPKGFELAEESNI